MSYNLTTLKRHSKRRELTPEQEAEVARLVAEWSRRYPRPLARWRLAGLHAGARRWVLHGPPPDGHQRLGYRTQKRARAWREEWEARTREWALAHPGEPVPCIPRYPGRGRKQITKLSSPVEG